MADKAFGVDQLDILGSGTPTISAPNQLNLDCHTVAISTSVTVGANLTVNGNIDLGNASSDTISLTGVVDTNIIPSADSSKNIGSNTVRFANGYFDTVYGDGSNLTNLPASGISTSPSNVQATWKLGGGSGSGFTFTGPGQDGSEGNPDIYLVRGQRYLFDNTALAGNHPFAFRNAANNADYTDGVSGAQNGLQYINVQHDAPAQLKYRCTQHPISMLGNIYIVGQHLANGADNRVLTATSAYGMNAESGLTYNGQKIQVDTVTSESNAFRLYNTTTSATTYQINGEGDSFTGNIYPRSDGNLDLGFHSGYKWRDLVLSGGVRFGSANAQDYLDDYEEGSWTPQVKGTTGAGTASYNTQVGKYLKIGSWVYLTWVLGWSSGSAGGEMRTTGFPFTPATDCTGMGSVMFNNVSIHSNVSNIATYIGPGNDYCYFYTSRSSAGWITVNYSSSGNLIANVSFRTA